MSLRDFTFVDAYDSIWGSGESGGSAEMTTISVRRAGEEDGKDGENVELFQHACIQHRPAKPEGENVCQYLVANMGGTPIAIASRDLRAAKNGPALDAGDASFGAPTGKLFLICKQESGGLLFQGPAGDSGLSFEEDGSIVLFTPWGTYGLGPNGLTFANATGEAMSLGDAAFNVLAPTCALQGGTIALGVGASKPLAAAAFTGTVGAGFAPIAPILNIWV